MAIEIKAIPTLRGDAAKRFLKLIEPIPETRRLKAHRIKVNTQDVKKALRKAGMI